MHRKSLADCTGCMIAVVNAGETRDALTASVKYSELDINSEQGAKQLYVRLRMASRRVCANFEGRELRERYAWKNCVNESLARAVAEVNVERVTALHRTHADRPS